MDDTALIDKRIAKLTMGQGGEKRDWNISLDVECLHPMSRKLARCSIIVNAVCFGFLGIFGHESGRHFYLIGYCGSTPHWEWMSA